MIDSILGLLDVLILGLAFIVFLAWLASWVEGLKD